MTEPLQVHPTYCNGTHSKSEVGDSLVRVHCSMTKAAYWFRRCSLITNGVHCRNYTQGTMAFCYAHRNEHV